MNTSFEKIKNQIQEYGDNRITANVVLEAINKISNTLVDKEWLDPYWSSMDLNDFIYLISISPIENWRELTDADSMNLISEIIDNVTNTAVFKRNMTTLQKRYSKPEGTMSDWIFQDDITDSNELLRLLKINTSVEL